MHTINYIKNFSEIINMQAEYKLIYKLEEKASTYILTIIKVEKNKSKQIACEPYNVTFDEAKNILKFLYENNISLENLVDILTDYDIAFRVIK